MDEWYNAVQAQINLVKYPPERAKILHRDIFWFPLEMRNLSLKQSITPTMILKHFQLVK